MQYVRIWFFQRDLSGSSLVAQIFTISLLGYNLCTILCNCDMPRYEENKAVSKIGRKGSDRHPPNICCVSTADTNIIISRDSPANSKVYNSQKTKGPVHFAEWQGWHLHPGLCPAKVLLCVTHPTAQPGCLHGLERWPRSGGGSKRMEKKSQRVWLESGRI